MKNCQESLHSLTHFLSFLLREVLSFSSTPPPSDSPPSDIAPGSGGITANRLGASE